MAKLFLGRIFPPADPKETFKGKTVMVTGANTGLGFEAAAKFVEKDADKVIIAVRSLAKGEAAKQAIAKRYGREECMEVLELDMNSYDSIASAVNWINTNIDRLDIVVLNAGVWMTEYKQSQYSWEETLQVNTISTTLLAILLLPKLMRSITNATTTTTTADDNTNTNTPVLEFVNSGNHARVETTEFKIGNNVLEAHNDKAKFRSQLNYGTSKLMLMFILQKLANMISPSSALINSVCPGLCRSDLSRGYDGFLMKNVVKPLIFPVMRTSEQGARTLVSGTTLDSKLAHGRFWQHDQIQDKIAILSGESGVKLQEQIWDEVVSAIRKDYPDIDHAIEQIRS